MKPLNEVPVILKPLSEAPTRNEAPIEAPIYPAIAEALIDPAKRAKLGRICYFLNHRGLSKEVRYGVNGPSFDIVGELLHITEPD